MSQTHKKHASTDVDELQAAIDNMDGLSQEGFSAIQAMANLVINQLDALTGSRQEIEDAIRVLMEIRHRSSETMSTINIEAEVVGCNHTSLRDIHLWTAENQRDQA